MTETTLNHYKKLLQEQRHYFLSQATKEENFRRRQLQHLVELLRCNETELAAAVAADFGKSFFDTYATELGMLYGEIHWQLKHLRRNMRTRRLPCNLANLPARFRLHSEPVGCVLIIGAWNYPLQLTLLPLIDAMAAGCTCIVKPSELAPHTSAILRQLLNNAFPAKYLHIIEGGVKETEALLQLRFDKIFFTGSSRIGHIVYRTAAENMTPVTLELGGKSPVIVTRHANIETAARRIAWGKCLNAGQTCVAPDYLLVERCIHDELVRRLAEEMSKPHYQAGHDEIPAIVNQNHYERLMRLLQPYHTSQKQIRCGGTGNATTRHITPTLITDVRWDDPIMQEEIFGPILPVLPFDNLQETLHILSQGERPLSAYLFSNNRKEQKLFTQQFTFGGGCINDVIMHLSNPYAPFGGIGNSGIGSYHGRAGFLCFSHQKTVLHKSVHGEPPLKYPPYSFAKLRWIKRFM